MVDALERPGEADGPGEAGEAGGVGGAPWEARGLRGAPWEAPSLSDGFWDEAEEKEPTLDFLIAATRQPQSRMVGGAFVYRP